MQDGSERAACASGRTVIRAGLGICLALLLGHAMAGCATGAQQTATLAAKPNATVAFESIDGPPPAIFQNLVQTLTEEAQARRIPVVTRTGPADYRVRGYIAAYVERGRTAISWVWDVYESGGRRALRIEGEVPTAGGAADPWGSANEFVMRQIARAGMERLAAFLGTTGPGGGPAIAAADPGGTGRGPAAMAAFADPDR